MTQIPEWLLVAGVAALIVLLSLFCLACACAEAWANKAAQWRGRYLDEQKRRREAEGRLETYEHPQRLHPSPRADVPPRAPGAAWIPLKPRKGVDDGREG